MKIRPVVAEVFHADGQTDRQTDITKLIITFHAFANAPKNRVDEKQTRRPLCRDPT